MDFDVPLAHGPFRGTICVPPSKSLHQRVLVLSALATERPRLELPGGEVEVGDDVRLLRRALGDVGAWNSEDATWGTDRRSRVLDAGEGGTGFRFLTALATLRPAGARTRITGHPVLRQRPHSPLDHALRRLGAHVRRRPSGSRRVIAGGIDPARGPHTLHLDAGVSSQFASALLLLAPRIGGLDLALRGRVVSRPYLDLTISVLRRFGIDVDVRDEEAGPRFMIPSGAPQAGTVALEADASAAAGLLAAAALTGSRVEIPGLALDSPQADMRLLPVLERMGAHVEGTDAGLAVTGPGGRLQAAGELDLTEATDLLPVVAALAAGAEGVTRIRGAAHARRKESDRIATSAAAIRALGGRVTIDPDDTLRIEGGTLTGGDVRVAGDHRIAFGFGPVGLVVPGVRLSGAGAVRKSHPDFLDQLARIATP